MLVLGFFSTAVWSADDLIASELVGQAREWQLKDRDDLAAEVWRKLLRFNPEHPEALVRLGVIEARAGNFKEAQSLYNLAAQLPKPPLALNQLSAALGVERKTSQKSASLPTQSATEQRKSAALKSEGKKSGFSKSMDPAAKTNTGKPLAAKIEGPSSAVPNKKAQPVATKAQPVVGIQGKPSPPAVVDSLDLTFSTSMGIAR